MRFLPTIMLGVAVMVLGMACKSQGSGPAAEHASPRAAEATGSLPSTPLDEPAAPDEAQMPDEEMQFAEGDPVMVKWKGTWWDAHVLQVKPDSWYIHYDGYNATWDEWVGRDRIRPHK